MTLLSCLLIVLAIGSVTRAAMNAVWFNFRAVDLWVCVAIAAFLIAALIEWARRFPL
jgi:hypothetical protein